MWSTWDTANTRHNIASSASGFQETNDAGRELARVAQRASRHHRDEHCGTEFFGVDRGGSGWDRSHRLGEPERWEDLVQVVTSCT
jgi:hypothetical protein